VIVTPASATVYESRTVQFQATIQGQSNQAVTWSLQGNFGTIDSTGGYTAPHDGYGGPEIVTATSQTDGNVKGTATVTVLPVEVKVSPATTTLAPGATQSFTASIVGLSDTTIIWSVQEASGGFITNEGIYTAPSAAGFYHVVAASASDTTRSGSSIVTVTTSSASFSPTGDMTQERGYHTTTLLTDGKVLMAGGATRADPICIGGIPSAELYDPGAGSFAQSGHMLASRYAQTGTLLPSGEVLIAGGFGSGYDCEDLGEPAETSAELFDPATGSFKATGSMTMGRGAHTATLLPNGKVLIVGGGSDGGATLPFYGTGSATAELYDPTAGVFTSTGSMAAARFGHTATLLKNGKVLVVGGTDFYSSTPFSAAEIYDPATGHFSLTGSMATPRAGHSATLLEDGKVLITGGFNTGLINGQFGVSSTAELYEPANGSFSATGQMGVMRDEHTATLLPNGMVLVAGGGSPTAEVYDPSTGVFSPTGSMESERTGHSATLLSNGKVLVAGGGSFSPLASAELYQ
jgi:WD40 repeat protein